ncbi:hypothetical protein WMY93_004781 [Mugilogobius chulae]|uniref:Adhesion G-protein coupled receptor D1 n=1 Tax=Mugilogobius chulae TaxID=88201 RepID=A0AAW0PVK6_9GOBI
MELHLKLHIFTAFLSCIKVNAQVSQWMQHPGLQVLRSAAHYWPLDDVSGIHELWDQIGKRTGYVNGSNITLRIHNHTVLPSSHNSSYVYTNDSAYTNISATVDIVEGMVNKGIFLNGDNGGTFLHFGTFQNTCISDPMLCGPEGITFSFFWKNHESESRFAISSGGKLSPMVSPSSPILSWDTLSFTPEETITGGRLTSGCQDPFGHTSFSPGQKQKILLYYNAATGQDIFSPTTPSVSKEAASTSPTVRPDEVSPPGVRGKDIQSQTDQDTMPVLGFLHELPNRTISHNAANNLTQAFLKSVEEVLSSPGLPEQSSSVVGGLIETVDRVMEHMATNLEPGPKSLVSLGGTSFVADYSLMKFPQNYNLQHYRFPVQGKNYISVPGEAFTMQSQTTIVGLFYHNMHKYYKEISPFKTRINEATDFKDHKIQVASNLISLKVEPSPALSINLSGSPLIKIVLIHTMTKEQQDQVLNQTNKVFLYCAFLDYSSKEGVWSNEGCVRSEGNMSYSVCLCNHLTNFAILMQVVPIELTAGHRVALSTIGYVGCSISIFCLAITLVTFAVLSSVSTIRNQRYHIHANLSFAILVAEILLLISARFDPGTLSCKVMAVLLHFFFLSAFAWMLVEGLHLYSMVVKVFGSEGSKHFYYYGIGWGSPLLICVVSMTSALDSYGEVDNCWLSLKNGAIWAFVAPALFVIVVNIGILVSVTRIISRISGENYKVHGDANSVKLTAKAVAVLLPILGISWIFGVLAVNTHSLVFLYIFAIFNSLQGFFVFMFHCLLNSEVRAAFKHKTKVWSLTSSSIRNINVKPFHSDFINGNKDGVVPTKMNTWDKSDNSANRIDLSAV